MDALWLTQSCSYNVLRAVKVGVVAVPRVCIRSGDMKRSGAASKASSAAKADSTEKKKGKLKQEKSKEISPPVGPIVARLIPTILCFGIGAALSGNQKSDLWLRVIVFFMGQGALCELMVLIGDQIGQRINRESGASPMDENSVNDDTIKWPSVELLSMELRPYTNEKGQPFFLNHVTGKRRLRDACMRVGMNIGSTLTIWFLCRWMEDRSLAVFGLAFDALFFKEAFYGVVVGASIVAFTFVVELSCGWLHFLQCFELFDKSEGFLRCFLIDVVFHLNVAMNEELPVRGWMLHVGAETLVKQCHLTPLNAFMGATLAQSAFFVIMHLASPGGTRLQSMANIFLGGVAASVNVMVTGGRLGFTLGWHFGWNICMGNVFGLSTSGIPISATVFAVAPHPKKQALHGGVFGPEGGVVSPVAYLIGMALALVIFGVPDANAFAWMSPSPA